MPVYMEPGSILRGDRIFAQARRVDKPQQVKEIQEGETIIFKTTVLSGSAYCIIEKPLRAVEK